MKSENKSPKSLTEAPSLKQSDPEVVKLWVKAGGRCEFDGCNEYLLEDEFTGIHVKIADVAHVVGRKNSAKSPRGEDLLPIPDRSKAENLMLLCPRCHRIIDKRELQGQFTKEVLLKYKKVHENRVRHLTSLGPERGTAVVCMLGDIRGNLVSISAEEIRKAVYESNGRYPRYFVDENNIKIDLTKLPEESAQLYWESGKQRINRIIETRLSPSIESGEIEHLSIFAIARIPFLVYLGYRLGDNVESDIYQKHRDGDQDWIWRKRSDTVQFKQNMIQKGDRDADVALILSLSGKISKEDLPAQISKSSAIYEIEPEGVEPNRGFVTSESTLGAFRTVYEKLLRKIEKSHKKGAKIHFFPAIPVSVAVACGMEILKDVTHSFHVYDRIGDDYKFTMEIK